MIKKILSAFLKVFLVFVITVVTLVTFPELWFRPPILKRVIPQASKLTGIELKYEDLSARVSRKTFRMLEFQLGFKNLNLRKTPSSEKDSRIEGKIEHFNTRVVLNWLNLPPQVQIIDELKITSSNILFVSAEEDNTPEEPSKFELPTFNAKEIIPDWVRSLKLNNLDVQLSAFSIDPKSPAWKITALTQKNQSNFQLSALQNKDFIKLQLPMNEERNIVYSKLEAQASLTLDKYSTLKTNLAAQDCPQYETCFQSTSKLTSTRKSDPTGHLNLNAQVNPQDANVVVEGALLQIHPWLPKLTTKKPCTIQGKAKSNSHLDLVFTCPIHANLKLPPVPKVPKLQLPTHTDIQLKLLADLDLNSKGIPYAGTLSLDANPLIAPILEAIIDLKSNFYGNLGQGLKGLHHRTKLIAKTQIPKVEKAVTLLHDTEWAIPAPLNNLKGELVLEFNSNWEDWQSTAPFQFKSKLNSPEQALQTEVNGLIKFTAWPQFVGSVEADLDLQNVRLSAPRLDVKELPRFFPDSQIIPLKKQKKRDVASVKPNPMSYVLRIKTTTNPLRIDSNLLLEPIAFDIKSEIRSHGPTQATVFTRPTNFEVFRRKALIEKLEFYYTGTTEDSLLDGRIRVQSGEAKVYVQLYGNPEKVKVHLTSDPPVPPDELWALLIFGEPMDTLDAEQQDSAQSTQRALSKGAFGILSLYLFASTPVERVDYDPALARVSVRFRVQEGTSLEVGHSEEEVGSLGLRKRLGKGWSLNAKVGEGSEEKESKTQAGATLEWSTRY